MQASPKTGTSSLIPFIPAGLHPFSQSAPHLGTNMPAEHAVFYKARNILLREAKESSDAVFWIKCVDTSTGKIAGGMCYKHERTWPNNNAVAPTSFDEGSETKRLSTGFYDELLWWRKMCMKGARMG